MPYVNQWLCMTTIEDNILDGVIAKEDYRSALTACQGSNVRIAHEENPAADADRYEQVSVYPNPNSGAFTISTTLTEPYRITVHDVLGNEVLSQAANGTEAKIDMVQHSKGVYFVKVHLPGGRVKIQKLIIQ